MSASGGKADITFCGNTLSRSLLGVKRTSVVALHMSAFDPKRSQDDRQGWSELTTYPQLTPFSSLHAYSKVRAKMIKEHSAWREGMTEGQKIPTAALPKDPEDCAQLSWSLSMLKYDAQ
jgi:hypothetical protein